MKLKTIFLPKEIGLFAFPDKYLLKDDPKNKK